MNALGAFRSFLLGNVRQRTDEAGGCGGESLHAEQMAGATTSTSKDIP
jgi:hypothetical protein